MRRQAVDKRGALLCCISCFFTASAHGIVLHDLLDDQVSVLCVGDGEEDFVLPFRCKGYGDRFRGDLDQFLNRLDILDRAGEKFFGEFDPGIDQILLCNRPRGERDEPFTGKFLPEVLAGERDERGKEPDPDRTECMELPAAIAVFGQPAAVPFQVGLDPEVCFLQCLPGLEVVSASVVRSMCD